MTDEGPKTFNHRPPARVSLPADGAEAEAALAAFIRGDAEFWPTAALEAQRQRLVALRDPLSPDSLDLLARQLPTLEVLWQRFAAESVVATGPDQRFKYLKAALHAQQAYARTFALVRTLRQQRGDSRAVVALEDDPDSD